MGVAHRMLLAAPSLAIAAIAQTAIRQATTLSSGAVAGHIRSKPAPPNLCPFRGGAWIAQVVIDESGNVIHADMVSHREGESLYLAWVRQFRYKPFVQDGKPVVVTSTVTVNVSCGG